MDETDSDRSDSYSLEESRKSRDRSKKHKKRHVESLDDTSLDDDEKERPRSHRRSTDSKKSKQVLHCLHAKTGTLLALHSNYMSDVIFD